MSNGKWKDPSHKKNLKFTKSEIIHINKLTDYLAGGRTLSNADKEFLQKMMKYPAVSPGKKRPSKTQSMKHGGKVRSYNFIN